jgi:hypothetical protein
VGMRGLVVGDWRDCVILRYWVICRWGVGSPWIIDVSLVGLCVGRVSAVADL